MQALLECDEVTVVGYLDSVKLQFDVHDLVLVHGNKASVLTCPAPREMFRFQRRNAFRVRPLMRSAPTARLRHPDMPETELALRVHRHQHRRLRAVPARRRAADERRRACSTACGSSSTPTPARRQPAAAARDRDQQPTRAACASAASSCRVGGDALRALQRYIDLTQKRGKLMALN